MPAHMSHNLEIEVIVTSSEDKFDLLTEAEATLRSTVEAQRLEKAEPQNLSGIMVTRHDAIRYTLRLDETVPYGETWETTLYHT